MINENDHSMFKIANGHGDDDDYESHILILILVVIHVLWFAVELSLMLNLRVNYY